MSATAAEIKLALWGLTVIARWLRRRRKRREADKRGI